MIMLSVPRLKKQMMSRRRSLEKAVDGMGQHGLVSASEKKTLMNLHEALKLEFERTIHLYKSALQKLDELSLAPKQLVTRSLSYGPAPTKASHQRQLSLRQDEIQERLIKNKTLLNVIEPTLTDNSLDGLLNVLRKRVEIDKDIVFQFTQLKKEVKGVDPESIVAPILMKFSKGFTKVLEIMKELGDDGDDDISSSDLSGYHSDSDSAAASATFLSRGGQRYNLMYRSNHNLSIRNSTTGSTASSSTDSRSSESPPSSLNNQKNGSSGKINSGNFATVTVDKTNSVSIHVPDCRSIFSTESSLLSFDGSGSSVSDSSRATMCDSLALQREVQNLKNEVKAAQITISALHDREVKLKCRLAEQAQKMFERGNRFENIMLGEKRPTALIRNYGNMYAQARVDTLDVLDKILPKHYSYELKTKLLFSVMVLAFRSAANRVYDIKLNLRALLQVGDFSENDPILKELDNGVALYLMKTSDTFNLTKNMTEICSQLFTTLYDCPILQACPTLLAYMKDCMRIAWCLTNQNPRYVIEYEAETFNRDHHKRFHSSNPDSDDIKSFMWPTLFEGPNGPCVHKGVVLT